MNKVLRFMLLSLSLLGYLNAGYLNSTGGQLTYFLASPTAIGNGGGFATESQELDALPLNPIIAAAKLYQSINISYLGGFDDNLHGYSLSYSLPTIIGVFSLTHTSLLAKNYPLGDFFNTQIIFSKTISTKIKFGFGLNLDYLARAKANPFGISLDISTLYESKPGEGGAQMFGFRDFKFGLLIKHLGLPNLITNASGSAAQEAWLKPLELRLGIGFNFLKVDNKKLDYKLGMGMDVAITYPFNLIFNGSLKNQLLFDNPVFQSLQLNIGFFLNSSTNVSLGYPDLPIPVTVGIVCKINVNKTRINFNYSLMPEAIDGELGTLHAFSLNLQFGQKDTTEPEIDLGTMSANETIEPSSTLPESF